MSDQPEAAAAPAAVESQDSNFWCVWTKRGWAPKRFHNSAEAAETEAERLARQYPGRKFIVMRAYRKIWTALPAAAEIPVVEAEHAQI